MTIAIYNQHCTMAGHECFDFDPDDPSDDICIYDVTAEEADQLEENAKHVGAGRDRFLISCAETIRQYL